MALDEKVKEAIFEAVHDKNQSEKVAQKIVNLLEELSNGTFNLNDKENIQTYVNLILDTIDINQ
jgi:hypothetical protein